MIKVYTPLSCSFGNVFPSFGHHMTKFYEFISNSRYLAKQNRRFKFLELMEIRPTRQDILQMLFLWTVTLIYRYGMCCLNEADNYQDLHKTAQRTLR